MLGLTRTFPSLKPGISDTRAIKLDDLRYETLQLVFPKQLTMSIAKDEERVQPLQPDLEARSTK